MIDERGKIKVEVLITAGLAAVAALLFGLTVADFAYPGESAHLLAVWAGLDVSAGMPYPVFSAFARLFGGGNAIAPVLGVLAVAGTYHVLSSAIRLRMLADDVTARHAVWVSRVAGLVAAVLFLLTPAVRSAATHAEPRMFFLVCILLALALWIAVWRIAGRKCRFLVSARPFAALRFGFGSVARAVHIALAIVSVLTIATPLAPAAATASAGVLPVVACFFVAAMSGYLAAWWAYASVVRAKAEERWFARIVLGVMSAVWILSAVMGTLSCDARRGAFADAVADRIVADLGERTWLVTGGELDDHLRLAAHRRGKVLNLVSFARASDGDYLAWLAGRVAASDLEPALKVDLRHSLALGIVPFAEDVLALGTNAAAHVAVFSAPDLWYGAEMTPVPETLFYGADPARAVPSGALDGVLSCLKAPAGWGSWRFARSEKDAVRRLELALRRHLGRVANDRAVWLQERGRDDEAFELYRRVLDEIDADNLSSLINLYEMAQAKHPAALRRRAEFDRRLKAVVDDKTRRYELWALATTYGYVRNSDMFLRLGFDWARSGHPGEARSQIRRAMDFVPSDRRSSLQNMLASLYAGEERRSASRAAYEAVLATDATDRGALLGLARLSVADGDTEAALGYLDRAAKAGGDDPRLAGELAMAALLRGDAAKARALLVKATDAKPDDLRLLSLLAAATMQLADAAKDATEKTALEGELERKLLPAIEKQTGDSGDYHVQTMRGFLALRRGAGYRREARDAFALAAQARPDVAATRDIVLGLDIALNDSVSAEAHAREALKLNRRAPTANYVMGSLALGRGDLEDAEAYLRRACAAAKPNPLALNDLAEACRRKKSYAEAESFARRAIAAAPGLYVAHETLGTVLLESGGDAAEAEKCIRRACDLSKGGGRPADIRMLVSLARVQLARGDSRVARETLRMVGERAGELSDFERKEYEELANRVK